VASTLGPGPDREVRVPAMAFVTGDRQSGEENWIEEKIITQKKKNAFHHQRVGRFRQGGRKGLWETLIEDIERKLSAVEKPGEMGEYLSPAARRRSKMTVAG